MFALGGIVIVTGFSNNHADFADILLEQNGNTIPQKEVSFSIGTFLAAAAVLFSSFIGFDSIAQAGGEAKNPEKLLPKAIAIAVLTVGSFYFIFTAAVYHAVPWEYIAQEAQEKDITAPGLFSYLLSPAWGLAIIAGAAIALINDLPAMLLSVSRLLFAWAEDGLFSRKIAAVHPATQTPIVALFISGIMATIGILGSHFAGDFFLGVDIMVTSMLVNFILMCLTLICIPKKNPAIALNIKILKSHKWRSSIAWTGFIFLLVFLIIHTWKDLQAPVEKWYFHATPVWLIVMGAASLIYFRQIKKIRQTGIDLDQLFTNLPEE